MDLGLEGSTAFVTGSSAGLGFAAATALATEGCRVAICSRNSQRIGSAAGELRKCGTEILPLICDVTDETQIREAMAAVSDSFDGGLNILVTNARGPRAGFVDDFDASDWRDAIDLNLMSTINLARHALPFMRKAAAAPNGFGRIVMITSVSAKQPIPSLYLSNVSRAGVQGFAKSLSEELGPAGITVNTILPGYTTTDRLMELATESKERSGRSIESIYHGWAEATAVKRLGTPEEFGAAVAYLSSRQAGYITGHALVIDGGRVKGLL